MSDSTTGSAGRLNGKIGLVTGAAQGIGAAIARRLAREGATVVLADINESGAQEVARSITAEHGRALALEVDVSKAPSVATCQSPFTFTPGAGTKPSTVRPQSPMVFASEETSARNSWMLPSVLPGSACLYSMRSDSGTFASTSCARSLATRLPTRFPPNHISVRSFSLLDNASRISRVIFFLPDCRRREPWRLTPRLLPDAVSDRREQAPQITL